MRQVSGFGFRPAQGWFTAFLGEAYRVDGQLERAREQACRGRDISAAAGSTPGVAWSRRTLGRIAEACGMLHEADGELTVALESFASMGARFEAGRTHLALAELARARGRAVAAARHVTEARRIFHLLRVPRYVECAERLAADVSRIPA